MRRDQYRGKRGQVSVEADSNAAVHMINVRPPLPDGDAHLIATMLQQHFRTDIDTSTVPAAENAQDDQGYTEFLVFKSRVTLEEMSATVTSRLVELGYTLV